MLVLTLDTATPTLVAGVGRWSPDGGSEVLAERAVPSGNRHAELLTPAVRGVLRDAGLGLPDVEAVVTGLGPGPFTGLRVGVVTAIGLADARGLPAVGVCSLDAIGSGRRTVVTDARRKEVYWARYAPGGARLTGPHVTKPADVDFAGVSAVTGAAVELYGELWPQAPARLPARYPEPVGLVGCALERIRAGAASDPLTPLYLRRPDAALPHAPKAVSQ